MKSSFILLLAFYCYGCSNDQHQNRDLLLSLNQSMDRSNDLINQETKRIQYELSDRLNDPQTHERSLVWQPRAALAKAYSDTLISYLENLKADLVSESGLKLYPHDTVRMDNKEVPAIIFQKRNQESELRRRLETFKKNILNIDSGATLKFEKEINELPGWGNREIENAGYWSLLFKNETIVGSLAILNRYEMDTRVIENKMTKFFYYNTSAIIHRYHKFSVIVSQTADIVKPEETITIEAGVGEFGMESAPLFKINRKTIRLNGSGIASYKLKTPSKPGAYTVPVSVEYYTPDGIRQSMTKDIKYTIFDTTRH